MTVTRWPCLHIMECRYHSPANMLSGADIQSVWQSIALYATIIQTTFIVFILWSVYHLQAGARARWHQFMLF